ncbi:MAG: carboxypeptidase regulatory-like domain-containing protein [Candidatus Melainabacteria bacterium]|nr:carboxypeptidase regulatory-like domain-containing protein [Candidatus Melainabacteria bacterium]
MSKKILLLIICQIIFMFYIPLKSFSFTRIVGLVFDGEPVEPDKLQEVLNTIKKNKLKNSKNKNPRKIKPDKLFTVSAKHNDSKNIKLEIDTSQLLVRSDKDIQKPISNKAFLDSVAEAANLWESVDIADIKFTPLEFASGPVNAEDGRNIITFRSAKDIEGIPDKTVSVSIINYARTDLVTYMNNLIMVKPGTILDADIVFDPTNDPCLAFHTTGGDFLTGGNDQATILEGGIDPSVTANDLENCEFISRADLTDFAVRNIGNLLGLEFSATASAADTGLPISMERYALTNDDKIGLSNIYPNNETLTNHGSVSGKVLLNKKPVKGAHVVLEDTNTGEPVCSTITDIDGKFTIDSVPSGTYNTYAEPLDGPVRKNGLMRNFFGFVPDLNFTTGTTSTPIEITNKETTKITLNVKELSASAFNINYLTNVLKEEEINNVVGAALLPIKIMPGETLTSVQFWGDNISNNFGTLSISGPGITISNVMDASVPISPYVECEECEDSPDKPCKRDPRCSSTEEITKEPDQLPGIIVDITCASGTSPGPRNIVFTGDKLDPIHPSFGLRDQITGGLFVVEQ